MDALEKTTWSRLAGRIPTSIEDAALLIHSHRDELSANDTLELIIALMSPHQRAEDILDTLSDFGIDGDEMEIIENSINQILSEI